MVRWLIAWSWSAILASLVACLLKLICNVVSVRGALFLLRTFWDGWGDVVFSLQPKESLLPLHCKSEFCWWYYHRVENRTKSMVHLLQLVFTWVCTDLGWSRVGAAEVPTRLWKWHHSVFRALSISCEKHWLVWQLKVISTSAFLNVVTILMVCGLSQRTSQMSLERRDQRGYSLEDPRPRAFNNFPQTIDLCIWRPFQTCFCMPFIMPWMLLYGNEFICFVTLAVPCAFAYQRELGTESYKWGQLFDTDWLKNSIWLSAHQIVIFSWPSPPFRIWYDTTQYSLSFAVYPLHDHIRCMWGYVALKSRLRSNLLYMDSRCHEIARISSRVTWKYDVVKPLESQK